MDWLQKRSVPEDIRKVKNPAEIMAGMMVAHKRETEDAAKEAVGIEKQLDKLAVNTALEVFRANRSEDKPPLAKSIGDILDAAGVTMITYDGQELTGEMQETADIVEWLQGDEPMEVVGETLEPEVRRNGKLLHRAKLSCKKAAASKPEDTEPDTDTEGGRKVFDSDEAEIVAEPVETAEAAPEAVEETAEETVEEAPAEGEAEDEQPARAGWLQKMSRAISALFKRNTKEEPKEEDPNENQ